MFPKFSSTLIFPSKALVAVPVASYQFLEVPLCFVLPQLTSESEIVATAIPTQTTITDAMMRGLGSLRNMSSSIAITAR